MMRRQAASAASDDLFISEHIQRDIKGKTIRGGVSTGVGQGFRFVISLGLGAVLARLLSPADFGLLGMVTVVTNFVFIFSHLGLHTATVQKAQITQREVSTLFWFNVGSSLLVALTTAALGPVLAWFYGEPRLTVVTAFLSLALFITGIGLQHEALLRRQMRFTELASLEVLSPTIGLLCGIAAAFAGLGYYSLIVNYIVAALVSTVLMWTFCRWLPGRPGRLKEVQSMLTFGRDVTGFQIVNYLSRNVDNLLIGRYYGAFQLGIYSKAYSLLLLPLNQIALPFSSVAVPALSRLNEDPERYRAAYLRMLQMVCFLSMPIAAFTVGAADWVVRLVLGPQWDAAAHVFRLLGIFALVQPVYSTIGWLFVSQGRARAQLSSGVIGSTGSVLAIVAGLPWGAVGVAASFSIFSALVRTPYTIWVVGREGPVRARHLYSTAAPFLSAALISLAGILLIHRWSSLNALTGSIVAGIITLIASGGFLALTTSGRAAFRGMFEMARSFRNRETAEPANTAAHP
jgi:PST family polysaccharide transporter